MRILVVEDEKKARRHTVELLAYHRYTADAAYDGETGLDNALSGIYDAVILDVMMPKKRLSGGAGAPEGRRQHSGADAHCKI